MHVAIVKFHHLSSQVWFPILSILLYPYFKIFNYIVYLYFPYNSIHLLRSFSLLPSIRWALSPPPKVSPFGKFGFHTSYGRHDKERKPYAWGCCLFGPLSIVLSIHYLWICKYFLQKSHIYTHSQSSCLTFMCGVIQGETQLYFLRFQY